MRSRRRYPAFLLVCLATLVRAEPQVEVSGERPDGQYHVGETARFTIRVTDGGAPVGQGTIRWRLSLDGVGDLGHGEETLDGAPVVVEGGLAEPGILRLNVDYRDGENKARGLGAAAFDPGKILPTDPPDDFRSWWDGQRALLAEVPIDAELTLDQARSNETRLVYKMSLGNIEGSRVRGWFCRPKAAGKYPAILSIPGAGVGRTGPAVYRADRGFLSVNISVHDQPIDGTAAFYEDLKEGLLAGYPLQGRESRETYYFRRVFLGLVRCIDFLTAQDDWDGANLIVNGSSQGGGSTLVAAGLDRRVTCGAANVPALCYHDGILQGRASGWPRLIPNPDAKDIIATADYYDAAHFAKYIQCPMLVTVGLIDRTCPATSVYAAYNAIPDGRKRIVVYPAMGHAVPRDWGQRVTAFVAEHMIR